MDIIAEIRRRHFFSKESISVAAIYHNHQLEIQ